MFTFKQFQKTVNKYIRKSGEDIPVIFFDDTEKNLYVAAFPDGMRITSNPNALSFSVRLPGMSKRSALMVPIKGF